MATSYREHYRALGACLRTVAFIPRETGPCQSPHAEQKPVSGHHLSQPSQTSWTVPFVRSSAPGLFQAKGGRADIWEPGGTTQVQGGGAWPLTHRPRPQGRHVVSRKPLPMTRVATAPSVTPTCTVPVTDQPPDPWNSPRVFMLLMEHLGSASPLEPERGTQGPRSPSFTHHLTIY